MALVLSAEAEGRIIMGADSAVVFRGNTVEVHALRHPEKIARCGPYLVGYCDNARVGQVLFHDVAWPDPPTSKPLTPFIVREVVPEIRRAVQDAGAAQEGRAILGPETVLLVAVRGELHAIGTDLTVIRSDGLVCIGSGRHAAYPVMDALQAAGVESARKPKIEDRIRSKPTDREALLRDVGELAARAAAFEEWLESPMQPASEDDE